MCNLNHNSNYCALVAVITTNTVFSIRNTSTYNLLNDRFFFLRVVSILQKFDEEGTIITMALFKNC